jgi:geranylgeranyl reductase family protein
VLHATPNRHLDVAIAGGGPAGAAAALALARAGVKVVVLEKAALPRYKTCGGGVVQRALRLLPAEARPAVERQAYAVELHLLDAGLKFAVERDAPIVALTMRAELDLAVLDAARRAGAEIRPACPVLGVKPRDGKVEIATPAGALSARFVIGAGGAASAVARGAGWPEPLDLAPALEGEVYVAGEVLERFSRAARFDLGLVPHGYGWIFPKRDHLSIGVFSVDPRSANLNAELERYLKAAGVEGIERLERHGHAIPICPREGGFMRGRVLLAGDAAGLADPLTGEGISWALESGRLAAESILEGGFEPASVRQAFELALERRLLPELQLARCLARLVYQHPRLRGWLFQRFGQQLCEAVARVFAGEATYRELLQNPLHFLKLFARARA